MKTFNDFVNEITCPPREAPVSASELKHLEKLLDGLFKSLDIDIEFTRHFLDRLNDKRNGKQITKCELAKVYTDVYKKYGPKLKGRKKSDIEKIIKSLSTSINIPVVLKWNDRSKEIEMVAKTIMRKRDFKGNDPVLRVENKMQTFTEFLAEGKDKVEKGDKKEYQAFFNKTLKKYGVDEPDKLKGDDKKKFYDEIDAGWKADKETD